MSDLMCLCGRQFDQHCRLLAIGQLTGSMKTFNTSLLTCNVVYNGQLIEDPNNFYIDPVKHGLRQNANSKSPSTYIPQVDIVAGAPPLDSVDDLILRIPEMCTISRSEIPREIDASIPPLESFDNLTFRTPPM